MSQVNMHEAKTRLSQLVEAVENGTESEIVIARNGKPVARIVPLEEIEVDTSRRLGIAEGVFGNLDEEWFKEFQAQDKALADAFYAKPLYATYEAALRARRRKKSA